MKGFSGHVIIVFVIYAVFFGIWTFLLQNYCNALITIILDCCNKCFHNVALKLKIS